MRKHLRRGDTKGSPSAWECGGKPQRGYDRWVGDRARGVREAKDKISVNVWNAFFLENLFGLKNTICQKILNIQTSSQSSLATKSRTGFAGRINLVSKSVTGFGRPKRFGNPNCEGMSRNPITISGAKENLSLILFEGPSKASTISDWPVSPKGDGVSRNLSQNPGL